jgi:phage terminase large subunit
MLLSRIDIPYDYIVETKDPRRFIKIPISKYMDLLSITPIPVQIAVINAINSPQIRFITAALSRRIGKTFIANIIGQMVALVPGCNILIMSPNYSLSQISFELQRSLIKQFELEVLKDNAKDKVIELSNNSTVRMGSVNQVDSVVGRSYDLIIFDEAALTSSGEEAFNVALRPTLDKSGSKAIFISTPRGKKNWFSTFYDRGFSDEFPSWVSIHATYHDNPRVSEEDIADAKKSMSEAEFKQEYLADFTIFEGQIWNFNEECVHDLSNFNTQGMDIIAGLDVGFKDATALCIAAYDWDNEKFYVLDEYYDCEKTTEGHAVAIKKKMDKWGVDFVYIDSAAAQTKFDFAQLYDISCTNAKKSVLDGIGYVGSLVDNDKIIIDKKCTKVLETMDQYRWDARPGLINEKPIHDDSSHMADAARYLFYSFEVSLMSF